MTHERPTMESVHQALEINLLEISRVVARNGRSQSFSIIDDRVVLVLVAFISDGRSTRTHQWLRSESPMTFPIFSISCCNIICITALIFRVFLAYIISTLLLHYYFGRESNFIFLLIAFICIHIIKDILELVYGSVVYAKLLLKSNGFESFVELTNL
jgi:hypothetical protein